MFKKFFKHDNPSELKNASMDADEKEYYELKNNIKTTQNVLNEQIETMYNIRKFRKCCQKCLRLCNKTA